MAIDVRAQLAFLKELQRIDLALHEIHTTIEALPEEIAHLREAFLAAEHLYASVKTELAEVEKTKRHEEFELSSSSEKLKDREAKLYAIKTTREYQAAIKEVAEAKKTNREREDRILQAMERLEELTKKNEQLEKDFAEKKVHYEVELAKVQAKEDELRKQASVIDVERPVLVAKIDVKLLRKYDFVRNRFADAVAVVQGGVCSGCHMNIPPQFFNELLRFDAVKTCPSCQRLLYGETPQVKTAEAH